MAEFDLPDGITIDDLPGAAGMPPPVRQPPAMSYSFGHSDALPEGVEIDPHPVAIAGAPSEQTLNGAAGSFATGANRAIAGTFGAPVDLLTGALNLGIRGTNALAGSALPPITNPVGGSQSLMSLIRGTVGETEPQTLLDKNLAAAGTGVGATASALLTGGALKAAGLLPQMLEPLAPTGSVSAAMIKPAIYGAAGGVGGYNGKEAAGAITDNNPLAMELGAMAGNLVAGGGAGLIGEGAPAAFRTLRAPFTQAGQEGIVGKVLNDTATGGDVRSTMPAQFPFGMKPTTGQASNDPGLLALERSVQMRTPQVQGEFAQQQADNNNLIGQQIDQIGTVGNPGEISQNLAARLDQLREAAKAKVDAAYQQVPGQTPVPTQPLKDAFNNYVTGLSKARARFVPNDYRDLLMGYEDNEPMSELMDLRSMILGDQRSAANAGDYNRANVLNGIEQALFKGIPQGGAPLPSTANQAATMAYQNAAKTASDYHADFNQQQPIASIFARNSTGGDRVLDSAVAEKLLGSGQGQADRVNQFVRVAQFDPDAMQAGRDWFATRLQQSTQGAPQAGSTQPVLNASGLRKFVQNNQPVIDSPMFTPQQRDAINQLVSARELLERTANGGLKGGSDTAAKLLGNNYIGALLGKWTGGVVTGLPKAIETAATYVGGHKLGGMGAIVGKTIGEAVGGIPTAMYHRAGDQVNELLVRAMRDPELARQLMFRATPSASFVNSPYLTSLLGMPDAVQTVQSVP